MAGEKFWLVLGGPGDSKSRYGAFTSPELARERAVDLAETYAGRTFIVLESVSEVAVKGPTWTEHYESATGYKGPPKIPLGGGNVSSSSAAWNPDLQTTPTQVYSEIAEAVLRKRSEQG